MTIKNMVGLEAEFILADVNRELVFPVDFGFDTDEYILLAEIRANPGETPEETVANFIKTFTKFENSLHEKILSWAASGYYIISPELNAKVLRRMGSKEITQSQNIYGTDLLTLSDDVIEDGKVVGRKISAGLHVHFSSSETVEDYKWESLYEYHPVKLPITLGDTGVSTTVDLYRRAELAREQQKKLSVKAYANRITNPVINHIVQEMDILLDQLIFGDHETRKLKYRQPGFYEKKYHGGFEYRSLPANEQTLSLYGITHIVNHAFKLLEEL